MNFESFEEAMEILKKTVSEFDSGKHIKLDDLIQNYEKGILAYNYCVKKLEETQNRIKIIDNDINS